MKRFKVMGLCLVAVFALSALLVSSASAVAPTYKTCIKANPKNTGKYSDKACAVEEKEGKGKYERAAFDKGKKVSFKGKNTGTPVNVIVNPAVGLKACIEANTVKNVEKGQSLAEAQSNAEKECIVASETEPGKVEGSTECLKEKPEGTVTSATNTTWKTPYKKCKGNGVPCNTKGKGGEEIETDQLESTLAQLDKSAGKRVGIKVKGLGPGGRLAQYECPTLKINIEVFGEVLAQVNGNLNTAAKSQEVVVKAGPLGLQSDLYEAEAFTEGQGKGFYNWGILFEACIKEQLEKGKTKAEAEGACFAKIGGPPAAKPISLISVVSGAIEAKAPATQNGITVNKGEAMLIEN